MKKVVKKKIRKQLTKIMGQRGSGPEKGVGSEWAHGLRTKRPTGIGLSQKGVYGEF